MDSISIIKHLKKIYGKQFTWIKTKSKKLIWKFWNLMCKNWHMQKFSSWINDMPTTIKILISTWKVSEDIPCHCRHFIGIAIMWHLSTLSKFQYICFIILISIISMAVIIICCFLHTEVIFTSSLAVEQEIFHIKF